MEGLESEDSSRMEYTSLDLQCPLCNRSYRFIDITDYSWLRLKLNPSDTMLETLKIKFPGISLDFILDNITGVTKPKGTIKQLFRRTHLHICFEVDGKIAYIDCNQKKDKLRGLDIYEV